MVWKVEDIDEAIDAYISVYGEAPGTAEFRDATKFDLPGATTMRRHFGGLKNYFSNRNITMKNRKGGSKAGSKAKWTKLKILEILLPYCINVGRMLTDNEVRELSKGNKDFPSDKTIRTYVGGFNIVADLLNVPYITNNSVSYWEKKIVEYIKSVINEEIITNSKDILGNGQELDIYIKSLNIAIECNGNYWHSFDNPKSVKDKNYHITKTNLAKALGITLIHIFESEWKKDKNGIKKYLKDILIGNDHIAVGNKIAIDNMKPINYTNIQHINTTEPELISLGGYRIWNCGTSYYWVK